MATTIRFPIEGMTCTSCVSRNTRALRKVDGVEAVKVDLGRETATVTFDPARTSVEAFSAAVAKAGYVARMDAAETIDTAQSPPVEHGGRRRRWLPFLG